MRKKKKRLMRTVAWVCCASLVAGNVTPIGTLAAGTEYKQALERAAREANIKEVTVNEEKTVTNSQDTIVDLSDKVEMYSNDVTDMEWSVDFKTTDAAIQSLMSIGSTDTGENNYMTLYVADKKVGFEFRDASNNFSKSATLDKTVADGEYHNLKLVVKTDSKFELFYDDELVGTWDTGLVFLNNVSWEPDYFTVGGMKRKGFDGNDGKNWYFNGTVKNIYARTVAPGEEEPEVPIDANLLYENDRLTFNSGSDAVNATEYLDTLKELETGTITVRYRAKDASQGLSALFSLSSTQEGRNNSYAVAYVNPASGTVGVEIRDTTNGQTTDYNKSSKAVAINDDHWHTISYVFGKSTFAIYVDGEAVLQNTSTGFFSKISDPTTVKIGAQDRNNVTNQWGFSGYIDKIQVWDTALTENEILPEHEATKQKETETETPEGVMKTEDIKLFYQGYDNSISYRIPALLTTSNGTVIAGIDKRQSGAADLGNIDAVIRRSLDGGKTWLDPQTLIDLPKGGSQYSFTIDASMVEDKETGRLFFIVDMFPESTALMAGDTINEVSSCYKEIDGERYYILVDANGKEYTIREKGQVYDENGNLTEYTVPKMTNGVLYKSGKECGNIFLRTGDNAGELRSLKTSHLWMVYSDDDGETWSEPTDITKGIKKDWQLFFGTGPGVGIQMENGRLVVPVYYTNSVIGDSQSSAVIYSDDHGETWKCGESPNDGRNFNGTKLNTETLHNTSAMLTESQVVEVKDSDGKSVLKLFCRSLQGNVMIATSYDGGETWEDDLQKDTALRDPYCQMTVVPYPYEVEGLEGKQLFLFANPNASNRSNGTVRLGYYNPDTDSFVWPYSQVVYAGDYAYSCLSVIEENNIGLFYEATVPNMMFTRFNIDWIMKGSSQVVTESGPEIKNLNREGDTIVLEASDEIFLMGNMTLKVKIDGTQQNLEYQSGSGTKKLVFALPENTPANAEIIYDAMDEIHLLDKYYGNAQNQTFTATSAEDLKALITEAEALNEADYSEGWDMLQEKLAAAKEITSKLNPSSEEIAEAKTQLQSAIDSLVVASVDKTALQTVIDKYRDVKQEDYSEKSWNRFTTAMEKAQQMMEATNATQSQIDEITQKLNEAGEALGIDKSALWVAIDRYNRYVQQEYEEDGWDEFVAALENAKTVANTEQLIQPQIDTALAQLTNAAAALKALPKVDKTELRAFMHECGSYKEGNYDTETWDAFQEVLEEAKAVSADQNATQETIDATYNALKDAASKLKVVAGNVGGVVTDESGVGIAGVTVSIGDVVTKTVEDGSYILNGIPIGTSDITADDEQYTAVTEQVTVEESHAGVNKVIHNFVLKEASTTVKGVVSAVGVPMPGLTVAISAGDFQKTTVTDENGEYCFENIPTRDYVIQTQADGYDQLSKEFAAVKQNGEMVLNLMLLPKTQEGVYEYENDYNDGEIYWDNMTGTTGMTFEAEDGANILHFPGGGHKNAYETMAPTFKNGCVEMDLTSVGAVGTRIGILLRATDLNNRVYVGVGDSADQYFTEYWGKSGNAWSNMTTAETFEAGKTMHLKAEIVDKTVTLWVNGVQVLSNTMENMPTEAGMVGLNCRAAKDVIVDNVKVTSYDETTGEAEDIVGRVSNNGVAVEGATVTLLQEENVIARVVTDALGNYKFKNRPYGTYTIKAVSGDLSKSVEIEVQKTDGYYVVPELKLDQETEIVDKSELEIIVNAFDAYSKDDYTEESFKPFAEALETAKAVLADENADQKAVDDAIKTLEEKASELVKKPIEVDKSVLQAAIATYDSYQSEDYTKESFASFTKVLEVAKTVLANENATQEDVDRALASLNQAAKALVQIGDKAKLEAVLSIYNEYQAEDYTEESFAVFANALKNANAVLANEEATQKDVDLALEAVNAAANGLKKAEAPVVVNKSSLRAVVTIFSQYAAEAYTPESFAILQNALEEANKVLSDQEATQKTVDAVTMVLLDAAKQLEKPESEANKAGLKAAVSIYGTYSSEEYTEESFAALTASLQSAKEVLANEKATQEEVNNALNDLNRTAAALEKKPIEQTVQVSYSTHVQNIGWQNFVSNGTMSGTKGQGLRLEGIKIRLDNNKIGGSIEYRTHVQNEGWQGYVADGAMSGTKGKSLRLEALQVRLTGAVSEKYDVYYRTHVQNLGWLGWAKNDGKSGTAGLSKRLEGVEIRLVEKGGEAPGSTEGAYVTNQKEAKPTISYTTHVQNLGWQSEVSDGEMSGTKGKSLRLEGIKIRINGDGLKGGVEYSTHVQNEGWQDYVSDGEMSGTKGKSLRLEGIKIRLTGELAEKYSVEYRTHVQNEGWQKWVKDDAMSGTKGKSLRLEGIEIRLVKK